MNEFGTVFSSLSLSLFHPRSFSTLTRHPLFSNASWTKRTYQILSVKHSTVFALLVCIYRFVALHNDSLWSTWKNRTLKLELLSSAPTIFHSFHFFLVNFPTLKKISFLAFHWSVRVAGKMCNPEKFSLEYLGSILHSPQGYYISVVEWKLSSK